MTDSANFVAPAFDPLAPRNTAPAVALFRQFMRAVTGDQLSGDAVAGPIIERLHAEQPKLSDPSSDSRYSASVEAFFSAAMALWGDMTAGDSAPFSGRALVAATRAWHQSKSTQAGILSDVLCFSDALAANMMSLPQVDYRAVLQESREIRKQPIGKSVLVVEDDRFIAQRLKRLAEEIGASHVQVAHEGQHAIELAAKAPPQTVIADYDLGVAPNGLEVVKHLSDAHGSVSVFATAYPSRVLTGSDGEPAFVIEKPYRDETLKAALYFATLAKSPAIVDT